MYHTRTFILAGVLLVGCTRIYVYPPAQPDAGASSTASSTPAEVAGAAMAPAPAAASADGAAPTAKTPAKTAAMVMNSAKGTGESPCPAITTAIAASGKKIFISAGNCATCHGQNAKGTPLAPDLTDATWIQVDGSYDAIVKLIHAGVPKPKQHPAPMPPMGGANLTNAQDCTVGAYVYSLSHSIT